MNLAFSQLFPVICPSSRCPSHPPAGHEGPSLSLSVRKRGSFTRKGSTRKIRRFECRLCKHSFSHATLDSEYRQQKREFNPHFNMLQVSGVSLRRLARYLRVSRGLLDRRLILHGRVADQMEEQELTIQAHCSITRIKAVQFDEMETFEHTKLKPLSIGLMVEEESRRLLGISLASMPASGLLAEKSRKKYGPRPDHRKREAKLLFERVKGILDPQNLTIQTDQKTVYPMWLKPYFPHAKHVAHKGRRGCIVGQGELKKIGRDPLFSINHTAAMIRANINRMFRRTWCTTKKPERLLAHLSIYRRYHNTVVIYSPSK